MRNIHDIVFLVLNRVVLYLDADVSEEAAVFVSRF
jgi:hypothetical protein